MNRINIDGSCLNNHEASVKASAGWGFIVAGDQSIQKFGKVEGDQTSTRAELTAFYEALKWIKDNHQEAEIITDSKCLLDALLGEATRKSNRDLWDLIEPLCEQLQGAITNIRWVPREENKEADAISRRGARALFVF